MTLTFKRIPPHIQAQLAANHHFTAMAISSWRESSFAANNLVERNFALIEKVSTEERAFLAWEIVTSGVELSEMLATALLNRRDPRAVPFHAASNQQIERLFKEVSESGASHSEAVGFLRLRVPAGFGLDARRVVPIYERIVANIQLVLREIATFWCAQIENAHWSRHLPMSLTVAETALTFPEPDSGRDSVFAEIAATPDVIDTIARLDEATRSIEYVALRAGDVRAARAVANVASQLIVNWLANAGLDPNMRHEQRWLFPFALLGLSEQEKRVLETDGDYILS